MKRHILHFSLALAAFSASAQISYVHTQSQGLSRSFVSDNQQKAELYCPPVTSMYVGGTVDFSLPETGLQIQPAGVKLDWDKINTSGKPTWIYEGLPVVSASDYTLAVKFPYPADAEYALYNKPGVEIDGMTYSQPTDIMVCGRPEVDGHRYGMLPFDIVGDGTMVYTADYKGTEVPIFGYGKDVDDFWRLYTAGGDEDNLSHIGYAHLTGIINGVMPTRQPLVVYGTWLYAVGEVADDVELTCSFYSLDEDGAFDGVVASKSVKAADFLKVGEIDGRSLYSIHFALDEPIVLDEAGTQGDFYAVMVSGFHAEGVEYFAPLMQKRPNPYEYCFGFYMLDMEYRGDEYEALSFVASHNNGETEMFCAFAINIDAEYPWLACENPDVIIADGVGEAAIESFYPAEDLTVTLADGSELPSWLSVEALGRFSDSKLKFTVSPDAPASEVDVLVSAKGICSALLHLKAVEGISDILAPADTQHELYDILGRAVRGDRPGIYIERRSDGNRKVKKQIL